jgi:hypothetical protein
MASAIPTPDRIGETRTAPAAADGEAAEAAAIKHAEGGAAAAAAAAAGAACTPTEQLPAHKALSSR